MHQRCKEDKRRNDDIAPKVVDRRSKKDGPQVLSPSFSFFNIHVVNVINLWGVKKVCAPKVLYTSGVKKKLNYHIAPQVI